MLVFVLGTGMNITSTFNTVDVRAASVEKTEDEKYGVIQKNLLSL